MPARVPSSQPLLSIVPKGQREALQRSKALLMRHAALSIVMALFLIGFNTAFTRGVIWFPWPVAVLILLWLYHLHKHLEIARGKNEGFNAWLDDGFSGAARDLRPTAKGGLKNRPESEIDPAHHQASLGLGKPKRQRSRDWLE